MPAGNLDVAAVHLGGLVLPWLAMLKLILALVVIGGLSVLLRYTAWGRRVRATSDDQAIARLQGIRVRPDGTLEGGAEPRREGAARGY